MVNTKITSTTYQFVLVILGALLSSVLFFLLIWVCFEVHSTTETSIKIYPKIYFFTKKYIFQVTLTFFLGYKWLGGIAPLFLGEIPLELGGSPIVLDPSESVEPNGIRMVPHHGGEITPSNPTSSVGSKGRVEGGTSLPSAFEESIGGVPAGSIQSIDYTFDSIEDMEKRRADSSEDEDTGTSPSPIAATDVLMGRNLSLQQKKDLAILLAEKQGFASLQDEHIRTDVDARIRELALERNIVVPEQTLGEHAEYILSRYGQYNVLKGLRSIGQIEQYDFVLGNVAESILYLTRNDVDLALLCQESQEIKDLIADQEIDLQRCISAGDREGIARCTTDLANYRSAIARLEAIEQSSKRNAGIYDWFLKHLGNEN